ncbi:putative ferric-chelate reductase 1 [Nothobranchius furzeri]|uniref:Ferric-chelate reductase 1 n=1 Tax=Nothobranchius furzeri TaxID=105023 RepID=A0A9D2YZG6_NOTFU|nr:putative ferric-chelate reductase 1 [Nothobranchius furzeri]
MDYRLILSVLLVTLSWRFMGTYAQNNSTANSTVTAVPSVSAVNANASGIPATSTPVGASANTGAPGGANGTTGAPGGANGTTGTPGGANGTTGAPGATNGTTGAPGATNGTTGAPGATNGTTGASNITTTGTAITSTIPVAALTVRQPKKQINATITTTDCGSKKLCVAEPKTCDPSTGSQCYYISAKQQSGQLYDFELSGQSDGYIAAGLSTSSSQADNHQAYICANSNSVVRFFTGTLTNSMVNLTSLDASNVKGKVSSGKIQCTFSATLPNTTTRAAGYSLSVSSGSYNPTTGAFGSPNFRIQTPVVNLSDPNATISNLVNGTNSTSGAFPGVHQQSLLMPTLLLIVTTLAFTTQ